MFSEWLANVAAAAVTLVALVLLYYWWAFGYWARKGVPYVRPRFPYGNVRGFFNVKEPEYLAIYRCYRELRERGHRHGGIFAMTKPLYLPVDPEYVKNILVTDFHHFYNRAVYSNEKHDPVSAHLLALDGQRWKHMRIKLTPAFTSGKMKTMFQTMMRCSRQLEDAFADLAAKNSPLNIKEMMARYTTDIIGSCAFGVDCNSFVGEDPEFRRYGRKTFALSTKRNLQRLVATSFPAFARFIGIPAVPKDVSAFFLNMIRRTVEHRRENGVRRNDVLQLLIDLNQELAQKQSPLRADDRDDTGPNGTKDDVEGEILRRPLTISEIASNAFIFFLGGFETSSTTMSFCFYELALNQDIQDRVRCEILAVLARHEGKITYESVFEMKYLRQCFDETLRKYPVTSIMKRKCTDDYRVPGTDLVLQKGTTVFISAYGLQRDPEFFPDPERFDPDRFSDENKGSIKPGSYLGFGDGPRICIGKRFGLVQMAVGVATLLRAYRVRLNARTKTPIELDPYSFIVMPKGGVWIELETI